MQSSLKRIAGVGAMSFIRWNGLASAFGWATCTCNGCEAVVPLSFVPMPELMEVQALGHLDPKRSLKERC